MHIVMHLSCKKCGYTWEYAGNKTRTSCSKCRTSITLHRQQPAKEDHFIPISNDTAQTLTNQIIQHEEAFMPLPLAKHLMGLAGLSRLIGMAHGNGDKSIRFKINEQGEIYLP